MTALRIINIIVWAALFFFMVPGAYSAAFRNDQRRGDPMRLSVLLTCIIMIAGNLRWLFIPQDEVLWKGIYVLAALDGIYIAMLAHAYGRGPRV